MQQSRHLVVMCCFAVFIGIIPSVASAQSTAAVVPSTSFHGINANQVQSTTSANLVTVTGTIQEVVSTRKAATSLGTRLVLAGPQGIVNASVGPYLSTEIKSSLAKGEQVVVAGTNRTINGENFLLVRNITIGNQTIAVRNENGFLIRPRNAANVRGHQGLSTTKGEN
jgi:hypothetical protein